MTNNQPRHRLPAVFGDYDIEIQQERIPIGYVAGEPILWRHDDEGAVTIKITPRAGTTITTDPEQLAAIILGDAWKDDE